MLSQAYTSRGDDVTRVRIHASKCADTRRFTIVFGSQTHEKFRRTLAIIPVSDYCFPKQNSHVLRLQNNGIGQLVGLSKEVCLYAGADWL